MRNEVGKWLPEIWKKSGGVITQRDAACIIGISDQSVKLAGDKGAIHYYECGNIRRYSFNDCILYKTTREQTLLKADTYAQDERLRKEDPEKWSRLEREREHAIELQERLDEEAIEREDTTFSSTNLDYDEMDQILAEHETMKARMKEMEKFIKKQDNIVNLIGGIKRKKDVTKEDIDTLESLGTNLEDFNEYVDKKS